MLGIKYSPIEQQLIQFAKSQPKITRVSIGNCPETDMRSYYIHIRGRCDLELNDQLTEFYCGIPHSQPPYVVSLWPDTNKECNNAFLGKTIWNRNDS